MELRSEPQSNYSINVTQIGCAMAAFIIGLTLMIGVYGLYKMMKSRETCKKVAMLSFSTWFSCFIATLLWAVSNTNINVSQCQIISILSYTAFFVGKLSSELLSIQRLHSTFAHTQFSYSEKKLTIIGGITTIFFVIVTIVWIALIFEHINVAPSSDSSHSTLVCVLTRDSTHEAFIIGVLVLWEVLALQDLIVGILTTTLFLRRIQQVAKQSLDVYLLLSSTKPTVIGVASNISILFFFVIAIPCYTNLPLFLSIDAIITCYCILTHLHFSQKIYKFTCYGCNALVNHCYLSTDVYAEILRLMKERNQSVMQTNSAGHTMRYPPAVNLTAVNASTFTLIRTKLTVNASNSALDMFRHSSNFFRRTSLRSGTSQSRFANGSNSALDGNGNQIPTLQKGSGSDPPLARERPALPLTHPMAVGLSAQSHSAPPVARLVDRFGISNSSAATANTNTHSNISATPGFIPNHTGLRHSTTTIGISLPATIPLGRALDVVHDVESEFAEHHKFHNNIISPRRIADIMAAEKAATATAAAEIKVDDIATIIYDRRIRSNSDLAADIDTDADGDANSDTVPHPNEPPTQNGVIVVDIAKANGSSSTTTTAAMNLELNSSFDSPPELYDDTSTQI